MTLVRALVLGLGLLFVTAATAQDKKAPKIDPAKLVGTWKVTDGMKAGDKAGPDAMKGTITITKDKITLKGDDMVFEFSYKVDAATSPAGIDLEITMPEGLKGTKAKGIVSVDDAGVAKLCYHPMGGERPKKFESTKDNGFFMFTMKHLEEKKK